MENEIGKTTCIRKEYIFDNYGENHPLVNKFLANIC
jgi:hypothetical protein